MKNLLFVLLFASLLWMASSAPISEADDDSGSHTDFDLSEIPYARLSQYRFFHGDIADQQPAAGVIPYDVASALFSDYSNKRRFVRLPRGTRARYRRRRTFHFPVGTVLIKTFSMPHDMRDLAKGERLLETRLLVKHKNGWKAYPYIWNEQQSDAELEIAGDFLDVEWIHHDGSRRSNAYVVPNINDCKGCHAMGDDIVPIGLKAKLLNRPFPYAGGRENQLSYWSRTDILIGAPKPQQAPRLATWNDPDSGTLNQRARAYLDINCAHCHNPKGPASNSGLDLRSEQTSPAAIGVYKVPVAAGRGSGDRDYGIVPGDAKGSILYYRMESTDPGIAMPEFGRNLVHVEALELIRKWIETMPTNGNK